MILHQSKACAEKTVWLLERSDTNNLSKNTKQTDTSNLSKITKQRTHENPSQQTDRQTDRQTNKQRKQPSNHTLKQLPTDPPTNQNLSKKFDLPKPCTQTSTYPSVCPYMQLSFFLPPPPNFRWVVRLARKRRRSSDVCCAITPSNCTYSII